MRTTLTIALILMTVGCTTEAPPPQGLGSAFGAVSKDKPPKPPKEKEGIVTPGDLQKKGGIVTPGDLQGHGGIVPPGDLQGRSGAITPGDLQEKSGAAMPPAPPVGK